MATACTPRSSHAWSTRLNARTPGRWPKLAGRPRPRAQRPLPSMMIPMWRGTCESKGEESVPGRPRGGETQIVRTMWDRTPGTTWRVRPNRGCGPLDLHYFGFFATGQGVDLLDLGLGDLLEADRRSFRVVLRHLALLLHVFDAVQLVAPHVANRDPGLLGSLAHELDVLAAPFLGQRRDRDSDDLTVVGWVQALLARAQRFFDRSDLALVIDLDHEQPGLGRADLGELIEGSRSPVVGNHDLVDQGRVGAAGADRRELPGGVIDRLRHLRFRLSGDWIDHAEEPTSVPISSPSTTRSMLP